MPQPFTIVTLVDADLDEFPIRLPGVYKENRAADIEAAIQILKETSDLTPAEGEIRCRDITYHHSLRYAQ